MTQTPLSERFAAWAVRVPNDPAWDDLVRMRLIDYLANVLGAAAWPSVERLVRLVNRYGRGPVPVPGGHGAVAEWAALPYGAGAHALEFDDTHQPSSSHPGAVVFSTALPLAIELDSDWADFASAVVAGYEVMCRLGEASTPRHEYDRGFHPTGTCGVYGATTTAGRLLGLSEDELVHAYGIATSFSSGSMAFLTDGAWTKHLHPGWAAHSGIIAARLAADGYRGPRRSLEAPYGYLAGHAPAGWDPSPAVAALGQEPLAIAGTSVKAHGCCRYEQGALDAVLAMRARHGLTPQDVAEVRVAVLEAGWNIVAEPSAQKRSPANAVDAQFSMPFGVAVALARGRASVAEHSQANVDDPEIRSLMERVVCYRDPELEALFPAKWPTRVEIVRTDGTRYSERVDHPKGDPENPHTEEEILAKLTDVTPELDAAVRAEVVSALRDTRAGQSLARVATALGAALRPSPARAAQATT